MNHEAQLSQLRPQRKEAVFDLVQGLGFDVSDWIETASNPKKIRANPKYCYDWSFIVPGKRAIFNLWHSALEIDGADVLYRDNFRRNADFHRRNGGKRQWITRGEKLDRDAAEAARGDLPVSVILIDGYRRETENPSSESSRVDKRQLDPVEWQVRSYDSKTGDFVLARGRGNPNYVDQFDVAHPDEQRPSKRETSGLVFQRDPNVRRATLRRAGGKCEYCGEAGFLMVNGGVYLETHHVIPLSEDGPDHISNVVALCPNDHRRAHHGRDRADIRAALIRRFKTR